MRNFAAVLVTTALLAAGCSTYKPLAETNPQLYQSLAARVGKTYYLREFTSVYEDGYNGLTWRIRPKDAAFTIRRVVTIGDRPAYEVEFGVEKGYLYANPFNESDYSIEDPAIAREREKQAAAERQQAFEELRAKKHAEVEAAEAAKVDQFLAELGVKPGKALWLRLPYRSLSGLTRITFTKTVIRKREVFLTGKLDGGGEAEVLLSYSVPGSARALELDFNLLFSTKDHSRGWSKRVVDGIKRGAPVIGMNREQLRAAMGAPRDVNETVGVWGDDEQWVYSNDRYVYLRNGKVYAMQR